MKKIISILLVFLLSIGVCCNFKVFAEESEQEEYNQKVIKEFGLNENPTEKSAGELMTLFSKMLSANMERKGWFSVNGKSDLVDIYTYGQSATINRRQNPNKKYKVEYSKVNGDIRSFTIDELEYTYSGSGIIPTDTEFGMPFYSKEVWNRIVNINIPQSPSEVNGEDVKSLMSRFYLINLILTENHPTWGLTVNGKMLPSDINSIVNSIKNDAKYKVEYTMDNGYIRHFKVEEITSSTPKHETPETKPTETPSESTANPTESTTDTQNQNNKQHILDDEPKTGL